MIPEVFSQMGLFLWEAAFSSEVSYLGDMDFGGQNDQEGLE